jgi:hypothetical protein
MIGFLMMVVWAGVNSAMRLNLDSLDMRSRRQRGNQRLRAGGGREQRGHLAQALKNIPTDYEPKGQN